MAHHIYMSSDEAAKVVEDCHKAFLKWKLTPLQERAEILKVIAKTLEKHKDSYAELMTNEMGKLVS